MDTRRLLAVIVVAAVGTGIGVGIGIAFYAHFMQAAPPSVASGRAGAGGSDIQMLREVADELGRMNRQISRMEAPHLTRARVDSLRVRLDALTRRLSDVTPLPGAIQEGTRPATSVAPGVSAPLPRSRERAALPAMWLAALISLSDPEVGDLDVALHQLDRIARFRNDAFVAFYRGMIHYRKAREARSAAEAMAGYQKAIRLLEAADAGAAEFAQARIHGVPFLPPERYILEIKLTLGLAYYYLYSYAQGSVREALAEGFRLNSRDNLIKYLRYSRKIGDEKEEEREAQAELLLKKLDG